MGKSSQPTSLWKSRDHPPHGYPNNTTLGDEDDEASKCSMVFPMVFPRCSDKSYPNVGKTMDNVKQFMEHMVETSKIIVQNMYHPKYSRDFSQHTRIVPLPQFSNPLPWRESGWSTRLRTPHSGNPATNSLCVYIYTYLMAKKITWTSIRYILVLCVYPLPCGHLCVYTTDVHHWRTPPRWALSLGRSIYYWDGVTFTLWSFNVAFVKPWPSRNRFSLPI